MVRIFATAFALATVLSQVAAVPVRAAPAVARTNHESEYASGSQEYPASSGSESHSWEGSSGSSYEPAKAEPKKEGEWEHKAEPSKEVYVEEPSKEKSYPQYGSGSSNWGGQGYNDCVQKCVAQYQLPESKMEAKEYVAEKATPTETVKGGTGTTHTIIVAPTVGVLRFMPFAVNASVGDTVRFVWNAGPHTVTESSALNPCNGSLETDSFASGRQNKSFVFDKVVNDTEPTFFYCAVATHCQKGMFGVINPASGSVGSVESKFTVGQYMQQQAAADPSMAALWSYVSNKTAGTSAAEWGMNMDLSNIPEASYGDMAKNTMYSQLFFAANPGALEAGLGASDQGNGIMVPSDITAVMQQLSSSTGPSDAASGAAAGGVPAASEVPANAVSEPTPTSAGLNTSETPKTNAAGKTGASAAVVAVIAVAASFLML